MPADGVLLNPDPLNLRRRRDLQIPFALQDDPVVVQLQARGMRVKVRVFKYLPG